MSKVNTMSVAFEFGLVPKISVTVSQDTEENEVTSNYRVVYDPAYASVYDTGDYTIRKVTYDSDGDIQNWDDEPTIPNAESVEELAELFAAKLDAFELPPLMIMADEDGEDLLVEIELDEEA